LSAALVRGLASTGIDVVDLGPVTTPMLYYVAATRSRHGCASGVQVTGSHNPTDYNGFKMVLAGRAIYGDEIQRLRRRMEADDVVTGRGRTATMDILAEYRARIVADCALARPMTVAVDSGNGIAGASAPGILRALGCTVHELYSEVDGDFPNHHPDPSKPENLAELVRVVRSGDAELGLAFDGDGDRLGVVTKDGAIIYPDRQLMLFARDVLRRERGATIIFDVKCSQQMAPLIRAAGGVPLMWKTGHSLVKAKMREIGAPLAGEMSGHIFFGERWYGFDDATYTAARLLEIVSASADPSAVLNALPTSFSTPGAERPLCRRRARGGRRPAARRSEVPGRARGRHDRRRPRRVRRRLRTRPRVEHDAGARPALRRDIARGAGADPGRLHGGAARRQARRAGRGVGALNEAPAPRGSRGSPRCGS
jgi:phosphomannomutase